jgi:PhzF family phenazine biosynthesis protein
MKYYVVDAFTDRVFQGNPAGVCLAENWPEDSVMQQIAAENRYSETAFVIRRDGYYDLRWFTPLVEVGLCGHATLGTSYVISTFVEPGAREMEFHTRSGDLKVERRDDLFLMNLPTWVPKPAAAPEGLAEALGAEPLECAQTRDLLVLLESEDTVRNLKPDFEKIARLGIPDGVVVTAKGKSADFVSRSFFPNLGVPEDPVCGSAHCSLTPFWAAKLGKSRMEAYQLSERGGAISCALLGDRVEVGGKAALYLSGEITV